jgi:hypothetical protein
LPASNGATATRASAAAFARPRRLRVQLSKYQTSLADIVIGVVSRGFRDYEAAVPDMIAAGSRDGLLTLV